ncbi:hypothetical protein LTR84_010864 [Exophiala bonariae]|uniref:Anaphase-promoting complex subunit 4 WD40 domain-containing protein n=1 Tax=Exophiala bonariae TaxID=1690606 RepID=A0AAV9NLA1_9EURO|nr:hypothetical protein LTR84_010864 [Exophiala bonariae]
MSVNSYTTSTNDPEQKRMPADLPGYYFDTSKNRYFKITANHVAEGSSSNTAAKYSRQAVRADQITEKLKQQQKLLKASRDAVTVRRSKLLHHPLLSFMPRLGSRKKSAGSTVKEFYVASLSETVQLPTIIDDHADLVKSIPGQFAVDEITGRLFSPISFGAFGDGRSLACVLEPADTGCSLYSRGQSLQHIGFVSTVNRIISLGRHGVSVWACQNDLFHTDVTSFSILYVNQEPFAEAENTNYSGMMLGYQRPLQNPIIELAVAPNHDAFATVDVEGVGVAGLEMNSNKKVFGGKQSKSFTSAWFKDNNVIVCGARDGTVRLADLRATTKADFSTARIQHTSGVSHVRTIGAHQVLVHGLTSTSLYDLRWCPQPSRSKPFNGRPRFNTSQAYLSFNVPEQRRQNRYGLGFAYDTELNIVLGASTDFHKNHCVNLWDASTGQLLESPLLSRKFTEPVMCAQFVDVRPQAKSILLTSNGNLEEWSPIHSPVAEEW